MWNRRLVVALLVLVCAWPTLSWAQQELRSSSKGASTPLPITGTSIDADHNALDTTLATTLAGERNPSSAQNSYLAIRNEANVAIISKTSAVTIGGGVANDTHLLKIEFQTALVGTCVLTGFADSDGSAQSITFAIGTVGPKDFLGAINSAGALTITCSDSGDDNKPWVFWRPR